MSGKNKNDNCNVSQLRNIQTVVRERMSDTGKEKDRSYALMQWEASEGAV